MNIDALDYIVNTEVEIIHSSARTANVDADAAEGIAKQVVGEKGTDRLTPKQIYIFENAIKPLIEGVTCSGQWNEVIEEPYCGAPIPDENLVEYYQNGEILCESCQSLSDEQQHTKRRIFNE
ncbi:hypothetical protein ACSJL2_001995 [Serratia sarumanii]|uniref:hypothetical protein n=2 Tax=Serratia TaxID=613 RepID=UPI0012B57E49|nr:hypothetical protein [Serratia marcescens]MBH2790718.1 hypothetical protein [Serratia marcescens]MBI6196340.1 hypothetical protein [Serratia marcescens]WAZ08229.1 hypothetical protein O3T11_17335 [Serratia marcescens]